MRKGGVGREEREEGEKDKVFPATTQASKDAPRKKRVPSYDESIQGHPSKKEGEGKDREKERKRERERERERERKKEERKGSGQVFPATSNRPATHQGEG